MKSARAGRGLFLAFSIIINVIVIGCLAACSGQDARIDKAEEVVRGHLKDPESASFRNVVVAADGFSVCGEINAKNSFGGYVGYRTFLTIGDFVDIAKDDDGATVQRWFARCSAPPVTPKQNS